mgnify:CR=1 FL=1
MNGKRRIFIDMDGVLCEFKEGSTMDELQTPGYFYGLLPRPAMLEALNYLLDQDAAEVFVLSSVLPAIETAAIREKNDWLDKYPPRLDAQHRIFPLCGTDKAAAVADLRREDVLFDDHSPNLVKWHAAGGTPVKILNEINGKQGSFQAGPRVRITKREDLYAVLQGGV